MENAEMQVTWNLEPLPHFPMQASPARESVTYRMRDRDVAIGIIFLIQTLAGVSGNSYLMYNYLSLYFKERQLKAKDLILMHLTLANFLTLFCKGVPQTMEAFGIKCSPSDSGYRLLFYLHRVGRGVSFGSTCLSSVFQAITIRPKHSSWAGIKIKAPQLIIPFIYLTWILSLLVNTDILEHMTGSLCHTNITHPTDLRYHSSFPWEEPGEMLHVIYVTLPDAACMVLMLWASGSMLLILHRHKQRMQHMPRSKVSSRSPPETRATQTILLLVSTFVCFYTLSSLFTIYLMFLLDPGWWIVNATGVFSMGFSCLSPFLLMRHSPSSSMFCCTWTKNRKSSLIS
ncbi:vomeronasal type-1 receptor 4-like [Mesocricetus auratus]|uniref:Vomeronasal type-1 receptor n=1 Tax=Mesocricetus auratus TaxID=10036 RepID=A0A1U7R3J1_MESAU|nr:vomeronasal type-1 receptor 4-like [Mesocricetus auratus]